jgi:hypothetical protein
MAAARLGWPPGVRANLKVRLVAPSATPGRTQAVAPWLLRTEQVATAWSARITRQHCHGGAASESASSRNPTRSPLGRGSQADAGPADRRRDHTTSSAMYDPARGGWGGGRRGRAVGPPAAGRDRDRRHCGGIAQLRQGHRVTVGLEGPTIEGCSIRYRTSTISKNCRYRSLELRYRRNTVSKKRRYRSSDLRYRYIPISKIYRYRQSLLRYLYTISKLLCFASDIEFRDLRYRCFFFGSSLGCLLGTGHRLRCAHCIVNQSSSVANAPPGPPSAAAAEAALEGAAGAGLGRRSGGRSRQSGHQRNAGARDSWRQDSTGPKLGMMICTRIGGSCLGLLQTKTISKFSRTSTKW